MTSTPASAPSADRPARTGRAVVDDVTAVILLDGDDLWRDELGDEAGEVGTKQGPGRPGQVERVLEVLEALAGQRRRPQRVVLAGADPDGSLAAAVREHADTISRFPVLVRAPQASRSDLVAAVGTGLPQGEGHWLWFLAPDSVPEPGALQALAAAVHRSSRVGVVGPKLVRADEPRLLRSLGHHLTSAGREPDAVGAALVDQGQLDLRQDVLGVPLAGSLVSAAVLQQVGGIDPAFDRDGVEGLDLGWRSHLAGHRVVVAPDAVVRQGDTGLGVRDPVRTRLRTRQVALARGSFWGTPLRAIGVLVSSLLAAMVLLLVKRPGEAGGEWADVRAVLSPGRGWAARRRFRRRRSVRPRDLAGLHIPVTTGWRTTVDTVTEAVDPRAGRSRRDERTQRRSTESGPVSEEFADLDGEQRRRRWWSWPLVFAVVATCAVVAAWGGTGLWPGLRLSGGGLSGTEIGSAATDAAGLWDSATDAWRGGGLGHDAPPETWLLQAALLSAALGVLPGAGAMAAGPTLAWVLALAPALSVVTAYLALRRVTRHRWLRAGLAVGWAFAAPLTSAVGQGRVGPALVHVLAPLLLAGLVVLSDRRGGARRTAATFATVLGVAAAAQWVPGILVLGSMAGLGLLVLGRGSARWRGVVLTLLPWILLLPALPTLVTDPVRLAGGAGATSAAAVLPAAAAPWQLVLLHPVGGLDPGGWEALALWLVVPLWGAALAGVLLAGASGRRASVLLLVAVLSVAGAQVAVRSSLGALPTGHSEAGLAVIPWPGTLLSVGGAALLLGAGLTLDRLLPARPVARGWWPLARVGVVALVAGCGPVAAGWVLAPPSERPSLRVAEAPLPAVAAEQARGPGALRTLVLRPADRDDALLVDLRGAEPEPSRILRDRAVELARGLPEPDVLEDTVSGITDGVGADRSAADLLDLGVGYVLLEAGEDHPVAADLDLVTGLTRVSSPVGSTLWRMAEGEPARVRVTDEAGTVLGRLDATGPHGTSRGAVTDLPEGAVLRAAEGAGWTAAATVSVDGRSWEVVEDGTVSLPAGDHEVAVDLRTSRLPWHLVAAVLALVTAFLALPVGRADDPREAA